MTVSSARLVDLCGVLGIPPSDLVAVEGPDELAHMFPVDASAAARLEPDLVRSFVGEYGDLAEVEIRTGDLTELTIGPGITDAAVGTFAAAAAAGGPFEAIIRMDKRGLAERVAGPAAGRAVRVFLFAESLRRWLRLGISRFEAEVWPEAPAPLVLAVLDTDMKLVGQLLDVVGGSSLADLPAIAAEQAPETTSMQSSKPVTGTSGGTRDGSERSLLGISTSPEPARTSIYRCSFGRNW